MKKGINFLLILVVLVVWGIAILRFYGNFFKGNSESQALQKSEISKFSIRSKDTFNLMPLERDCFLNKSISVIVSATPHKTVAKPAAPKLTVPVNFPIVEYYGYIKSGNSEIFLLNVNQKTHRLKLNQNFEGIKLVKAYKDSVQVAYMGRKKTLKKIRSL